MEAEGPANYALLFPRKGTSDYAIIRGMPSLTAVTVCLWMKTADKGNEGVPLGYNVGSSNEVLLIDYRNFGFYIGGTRRYNDVWYRSKLSFAGVPVNFSVEI